MIDDFAVTGFEERTTESKRTLHVQIVKDGVEVLNAAAVPSDYWTCGQDGMKCASATFHVPIPDSLVRASWGPCDQSQLTGQYAVTESHQTGGCSRLFTSSTVTLDKGVLLMADPNCRSQMVSSTASPCLAKSVTVCSSLANAVTWSLSVADPIGDGSKLLGSGSVEVIAPAACQGQASLELVRQ
jgi:hypothetical protein